MMAGDEPPRLVTYGISDELAGTVGLMCGGTVHIFIHELTPRLRRRSSKASRRSWRSVPSAIATLLDGPHAGSKLYVDESARLGSLGGSELLDINVEREARGLVSHGRTTVRHFGPDGTTLGTGLRVHVAAHAERPQMLIFGAIDFSASLATIAGGMGYRVTIADPREPFLSSARFSILGADDRRLAPGGRRASVSRTARCRARLLPRLQARCSGPDRGVRHRRRLHRRARQPQDDGRAGGSPARGRSDRRGSGTPVRARRA